ncbi:hypothetical protein HOLleu_14211 [Holothuria leucospilota]|uniref:IgGFc-binding protein N-terminal domain-containing protein n=1 Tax=Holothuria leucospilota TaxID=206669 RepID=A0A9Q1C7Z2_HOLLE|nr:hypothetical protein HOLleu_14211 [Holothuria leucospilota]
MTFDESFKFRKKGHKMLWLTHPLILVWLITSFAWGVASVLDGKQPITASSQIADFPHVAPSVSSSLDATSFPSNFNTPHSAAQAVFDPRQPTTELPLTIGTSDPTSLGQDDLQDLYAFTFIDIYCGKTATAKRRIYIGTSSHYASSGRIFFPSQNVSDINFVLAPGAGRFFWLPDSYQTPYKDDSGMLLNKTVVVAATENVVVYAYQGCADVDGKQASAFRVHELQRLGTDYWVLTYYGNRPVHLGMVSVEDDTLVTISFNHTDENAGINEKNIMMNKYDTFYLVLPFDATGTRITSNRKISVIVGLTWIALPVGSINTEPFCETLEPTFNWGKSFSVAHFLGSEASNDYIVKLLSTMNNNTVYLKQGSYRSETILQQGQSKELLVTANVTDVLEINSSKDIIVAQIATKGDPAFTNPAMTFIPPHQHGTEKEISFPVFDLAYEGNVTNYLTVWVPPTGQPSDLGLDNILTVDWKILGTDETGWRIFQTSLQTGSHIIRIKSDLRIRGIVFGSATKRSFAHPVA